MTGSEKASPSSAMTESVDVAPELGRFMTAMRRLQDAVVSTSPSNELWSDAAGEIDDLCERLELHRVPAGFTLEGRGAHLPGLGHPLMPPWFMTEYGPDGVTMEGHFSRFHVGSNDVVNGGVIPLLYDWHFGMIVSAADRRNSRTAYLHIEYRKITPINQPLTSRGQIDKLDGRKAFVTAQMTDAQGNVLSEASALMIQLTPEQP
ncbi:thioesterase [Mycobacterium paraffinicum]|uniref:Thioesterase n=1 Tax=Mycobacterium paraffinicum TaxID=53378 RepID=A0A1Q4HNC0_9MYCO|nr:thioesterase [Mycobacterium paraffinicum]